MTDVLLPCLAFSARLPAHLSARLYDTLTERPMKVELALDLSQMVSLASRVAPAPAVRGVPTARRGRGNGRTRNPRPAKKSAEELDAEMAVSSSISIVVLPLI